MTAQRAPARFLRRFSRDARGVSAVEFALLLPVMTGFYFGAVELSNALIADRKATSVAATAADLAAQAMALSNQDMDDIFGASAAILAPFDSTGVEIVLTSASDQGGGTIRVDWSDGHNAPARAEGSTMEIPDALLLPGGSVIVAEVRYTYTSVLGQYLTGGIEVNDTFYARPRRTMVVARVD